MAQNACGGTIEFSGDCAGNDRGWHISCCPDGYRVQGVAYTDIQNKDAVDAVSIVCRHKAKGNNFIASSDFQRDPKQFVCNNDEIMAGIYSKDSMEDGGKSDTLDGLTAICQKPGQTGLRKINNSDIAQGREGREQTVRAPKRLVGIASKDKEKGTSDEADCVTIITH